MCYWVDSIQTITRSGTPSGIRQFFLQLISDLHSHEKSGKWLPWGENFQQQTVKEDVQTIEGALSAIQTVCSGGPDDVPGTDSTDHRLFYHQHRILKGRRRRAL
jgi:hypothetical protein